MSKRPVPRAQCKDCHAQFALHRARCTHHDRPFNDDELDIYACPECGSYAVEDTTREQTH